MFQIKFTLWQIKLNIYIWEIKFTSRKQYLFDRLCSIKVKKTRTGQSILQVLSLCSNWNDTRTFKSSSCKKIFLQCICYRCNLLQWMSFIPCGNWKTFLTKVYRYFEILSILITLLYLKQVFWKKSIFYVFYLHSAVLIMVKC